MRRYLTELNNEIEKLANNVDQYDKIPPEMESIVLGILCDMIEEVELRANTLSNTQRDIFLSLIYLKFSDYLEEHGKRLIPEGVLNTNSPQYKGQCILMSLIDIFELELYIKNKDNIDPTVMQFLRASFIFDETMSVSKSVDDSINDFFSKCQEENIHPSSVLLKLIELEKSA